MHRLEIRGIRIKEPFSALSHAIGIPFAITMLVTMVSLASMRATTMHVISFAIFGAGMVSVYVASTLYHWLPLPLRWERRVRKLDQSAVYLMIAGTYTPVCLVGLGGVWGYTLLSLIWGLAIAGILTHWLWHGRGRRRPYLHTGIYLGLGWLCVAFAYPIFKALSTDALFFLVLGGVLYSVGALAYALKWPNPLPKVIGAHEVFHVFVLGGTACHTWLMVGPLMALGIGHF